MIAELPYRPFLYTLSQIQDLLLIDNLTPLIYWDGRSTGIHHPHLLKAVNLMPDGEKPEWRVEEAELVRFMVNRGFQIFYRPTRHR
jgi:hypothetical protein